MRVRGLAGVGVLLMTAGSACSSDSSARDAGRPDANADRPVDMTPDLPPTPSCGPGAHDPPTPFPCCYFDPTKDAAPAASDLACMADDCFLAPDTSCSCPVGYACAVVCPSPLGGCGGSPTCCRVGTSTRTDGPPTDAVADALTCSAPGESCLGDRRCCGGLTCCKGPPIPEGGDRCEQFCPMAKR